MIDNPYLPHLVTITDIVQETYSDRPVKTFKVVFQNEKIRDTFTYKPGQCVMLNVIGKGESFVAISSSPIQKKYLEFSVMKLGKVTSALHQCEINDILAVRGPYGNGFPLENFVNKNIIVICGGIGMAPLRSLINYVLDKSTRKLYDRICIIYGARASADLCYKDELTQWKKCENVDLHLSIDKPEEYWNEYVGFVPSNLLRVAPSPENAVAITCGPPIMIKYVIQNLLKLNFKYNQIYTTLEYRMKCGIGMCGRCNIGRLYICKDGPVFSYETLKDIPGAI